MRLTVDAFEKKVAQGILATCYVLVGTDSFLLQQGRDHILKIASAQGFADRTLWELTSHTNWAEIHRRYGYFDLFQKSLIDLRCIHSLTQAVGNQLYQFTQSLTARSPAPLLIISLNQSIQSLQTQHWFSSIALVSELVVFETPYRKQLPKWIAKQLQPFGLRLTRDATSTLIHYTEGNLPATFQLIKKLALIYGQKKIELSLVDVEIVLEDQATFALFHLTDAVLQKNARRCLQIIQQLREKSISQALLLGYLLRLLRTAARLRSGLDQGYALPALFEQHGVWQHQQSGFKRLVQHIQMQQIPPLFQLAYHADRCIKGAESENGWHRLCQLSLCLAGQSFSSLGNYNINQ